MAQQTFEELVAAVKQAESRGKRYKDDGKTLTTSSKGALGEMQVMPKTITDPGFGVVPAKDKSPDEIARVGRDYLQAMKQKYGDTEKALIAYNWGPGSTDKWIASGANPEKLPAETKSYVERVKGLLGGVSRETSTAKAEVTPAEEVMTKALPAGTTASVSRGTMMKGMPDVKSMPASYQAAFALAALADAQDEEDDKAFDENKGTETEKFFAEYKPVNHLASLDLSVKPLTMADGGEVEGVQNTARKGEAYQELEKYLQARGEMPTVKIGGIMPDGTNGMFSSDNLNIGSGVIKISSDTPKKVLPSVLTHEMTHAADRQMKQQAIEQGMFGKSNQFTDAYAKLVGPEGVNRTKIARKINPEWASDNQYYRAEPKEVAAHGVGAFAGPNIQDRAPRHVDATAATEFQILMELAQRNVDKGPKGLEKIPAFFRKMGRYADGGDVEGESTKFATQVQPAAPVQPPATRSAKELDAYIKAMNPGAKLSYFPEGGGTLGYVNSDAPDVLNIQKGLSPQRDEETKLHELEHSLGFRTGDPLGRPKIKRVDNNYQAYYMLGDWRPLAQFTTNMVENKDKLEKFFGRPLNNAYFQPETLASVKKQQGDTSALFDEQMATLSALEQITGKSLTRDPEMKKLFPDVKVMSVYDALTGPRQTRLDARDLPPSTPQPAYVYRDNPVTQFLHKTLLRDNFYPYQKPVKRADGSPETGEQLTPQQIERIAAQEAADRDAASTAAFIAQKSGIGRKEGNISKALKSGEGQVEMAKGMTMLPQNIVGAPVDLATMAMRPFSYDVEKPVMGSEWLKEKTRDAGLAFKPSEDPTLAGFFETGNIASGLVNPAGATRAGVKAAEKTGEAAKMLARDFQQYNQNLAVPGASYAIRNRGTPFLGTPQQVNYQGKVTREAMSEADDYADWLARNFGSEPSLKTWLRDKVGAYLRRDFGTESDQMVQAADQGKKLHFMSPKLTENVPHELGTDIGLSRELEGFPKSGFAKTPQGQKVEEVIDSTIYPLQLQDITSIYQVPSSMRQFVDTNPEMRVSQMGPIDENLKFDELAQAMGKMFKEKEFKAYGETVPMPKEYILTEDTLKGLTPAQASNRVANKMDWVEKKRAELAGVAIAKDPRIVSHSYDNGSKWISPGDLADHPQHAEMVKDIGCAGGWCTDKSSFAMDYGSGENRLNILLDKKFEPRVQLTLNTPQPSVAEFARYIYLTNNDSSVLDEMAKSAYGWHTAMDAQIEAKVRAMPEYQQYVKQYHPEKSITEIKGQFNNADLRNSPYLKQVQDFVKRQGPDLQTVSNLDGIDMLDMRTELPNMRQYGKGTYSQGLLDKLLQVNGNSYFAGKDEFPNLIKKAYELPNNAARTIQMNLFQTKATGGMIERQPNDNRRYL